MDGTAPAPPDISDVGRTFRCYESEEERQVLDESTCCAKETSQFLLEGKQANARREEDLESEIERGVIALNALVPIKRLPDDVLSHIFELHCTDSLPLTLPLRNWGPAPPPGQITLSHVCSAWREIMPTFFSSIKIVPRHFDSPQTFVSVVKAANIWLSRAKGLHCSIDIDFPEDDEYWDTPRSLWEKDWHENIIRDLISLHKFKKLGVTFADHHLRDLLQLPGDKLSCVEDLCLRYTSLNEDDTASPFDLHKLSNLTSFSLLPDPFDFEPDREGHSKFAGIPWHNLRHIKLRLAMPALFCLDALKHCSAVLETCSLVITGDHSFKSSPRGPVHLFQLRKLEVIVSSPGLFRDEGFFQFFLLSLRFPRLQSLTLGSSGYPVISDDLQMLFRVQNASQMHLEELIISDLILSIDVRTLLTSFPTLRRLGLPRAATFTEDAVIEVGAGSIGVFLKDLTIRNPDLDLEMLLQMVKARSRAGIKASKHSIEVTEFKSVTLYCNDSGDDVEGEVCNLIIEICLLGVDLNVFFEDSNPHDYYSDDSD